MPDQVADRNRQDRDAGAIEPARRPDLPRQARLRTVHSRRRAGRPDDPPAAAGAGLRRDRQARRLRCDRPADRAADGDVRRKPATALRTAEADARRRRERAARQRLHVRRAVGRKLAADAVQQRNARRARERAVRAQRLSGAAVRPVVPRRHDQQPGRRLQPAHGERVANRPGRGSAARRRAPAAGAARDALQDPALHRSPGAGGRVRGAERSRRRDRRRRARRRPGGSRRARVPHRSLRRRAVRPVDRRARRRWPVRPRHDRRPRADRSRPQHRRAHGDERSAAAEPRRDSAADQDRRPRHRSRRLRLQPHRLPAARDHRNAPEQRRRPGIPLIDDFRRPTARRWRSSRVSPA